VAVAIRNTRSTWGAVSRAFHAVTGALILVLLGQGWWMTEMTAREARFDQYAWHASVGYFLLAAMVLRLVWRGVNPAPDYPGEARWERIAAAIGHWALYGLTLATSVAGWALAGTFRRPLDATLGGLVHVPAIVSSQERSVHKLFEEMHELFAWTLAVLIAVHVAAALYHWIARRDGVMERMLPMLARR
jgi:cytochrome b561